MRKFIFWGGVLGAIGVAAGAFGAHALRDAIPADRLETFRTGASYHQLHAVALALCGLMPESKFAILAGRLFTVGILIFAGSLYLLALTGQKWLGAITPLGGLALIAGWAALALSARASH